MNKYLKMTAICLTVISLSACITIRHGGGGDTSDTSDAATKTKGNGCTLAGAVVGGLGAGKLAYDNIGKGSGSNVAAIALGLIGAGIGASAGTDACD